MNEMKKPKDFTNLITIISAYVLLANFFRLPNFLKNFEEDGKMESIIPIIFLIILIRLACKEIHKIRWNAYNDKVMEKYHTDWAKKEDIPKNPNNLSKLLIISVLAVFVIAMSNNFFVNNLISPILLIVAVVGTIFCKLRYKTLNKEYEEKLKRLEELREEYIRKKKEEKKIIFPHQDIEFTGASMGVYRSSDYETNHNENNSSNRQLREWEDDEEEEEDYELISEEEWKEMCRRREEEEWGELYRRREEEEKIKRQKEEERLEMIMEEQEREEQEAFDNWWWFYGPGSK